MNRLAPEGSTARAPSRPDAPLRRLRPTRLLFLGALFAISCGGGSTSCLSCGGNYSFPKNDPNRPDAIVQDEVARARITQAFIDFIKPQIPPLLEAALGSSNSNGVINIPIPDQNNIALGVDLQNTVAKLYTADLNRMTVQFLEPSGVRIAIDNMRVGLRGEVDDLVFSTCDIFGDLENNDVATRFDLDITIDPGVGPDPDRNLDITVNVSDVSLEGIGLELDGNLICETADLLQEVVTAIVNLLEPILNNFITPVVNNFIQDAIADFNNQPAKIEQQINLFETTGFSLFRKANPFGLFVSPEVGKFPVVDRGAGLGMEVTVSGGAEAELADCVAGLEPFAANLGPVPVLGGTDSRNRPYHLGFTMASSLINQILYAVHRSGAICLRIGSEDVRELTGGAFSLNASILSLLASDLSQIADDKAPVFIQLVPRNPPNFTIGSGEVIGQDSDGNDIVDPLLQFDMEDLGLAFYVLIQDRYVRIFEVNMTVDIGANIVVMPDNTLQLALTEIDIGEFEEVFNELLPNSDFAEVIPSLIDLAFSALLSSELVFDVDLSTAVSDALGGAEIYMRVNDIFRDGAQEDFLTLTMTFTTTTATGALSLAAATEARLHEEDLLHERRIVDVDEIDPKAQRTYRPTGRVRLVVGEHLPYTEQHALEYQVRVDEGFWHMPVQARPDGTLVVSDLKLKLPGWHSIEVRARYQDDYMTLDPTAAVLNVLVDPIAPAVAAQVRDEAVHINVRDDLALTEEIELMARLLSDDSREGSWFTIALAETGLHEGTGQLPLAEVGTATRLELFARDGQGNQSAVATVRVGLNPDSDAQAGCACHAAQDPHSHGEGGMFALFALLALAAALRFGFRS